MTERNKFTTLDIVYVALSVALITVCSWISIPFTIPITMQTFAVFAIIGLMGVRRSTISVITYILLGGMGVPVLAGFNGGFGVLAGNTGGYIIGFLFTCLVTGSILKFCGRKLPVMIIAMGVGLIVCYIFGTAWFMYFYARTVGEVGLVTALSWCVIPFIIPDAVKIGIAILTVNRVSKYVRI